MPTEPEPIPQPAITASIRSEDVTDLLNEEQERKRRSEAREEEKHALMKEEYNWKKSADTRQEAEHKRASHFLYRHTAAFVALAGTIILAAISLTNVIVIYFNNVQIQSHEDIKDTLGVAEMHSRHKDAQDEVERAKARELALDQRNDIEAANQRRLRIMEYLDANREKLVKGTPEDVAGIRAVMLQAFSLEEVTRSVDAFRASYPSASLASSAFAETLKMAQTAAVIRGKVEIFGGAADSSYAPGEGLSLINEGDLADTKTATYFLPPDKNSGLARRLNPESYYVAARWDFIKTPRAYLRTHLVNVTNPANPTVHLQAKPVDTEPHRGASLVGLSPSLAKALGLEPGQSVAISFEDE